MSLPPTGSDERDLLAGEYALGVLEPDELAAARSLTAADRDFAAAVARWRGRLAALLDEVEPVEPPAHHWAEIERRLGWSHEQRDNVVVLRRRVSAWRGAAAAATAMAASLALFMLVQPRSVAPPAPGEIARPAPLIAVLGGEQQDVRLVASWDPAARSLVVAAAGDIATDRGRAHELWVIPADGTPRSLGLMPPSARMHTQVDQRLATLLRSGSTLAISVEPQGGSPTGLPTGPVIASGTLGRA